MLRSFSQRRARRLQGAAAAAALVLAMAGLTACRTPPRAVAPPPAYPVRVALVSDTHTTRGTNAVQRLHAPRLEQVIQDVNLLGVDLVLMPGDLTENGEADEYRDFKRQIQGFKAPVWMVPGNHDVGNKNIAGSKKSVSSAGVRAFERALGPSTWVREHAGLRVVGANGPLFGSGLQEEARMWSVLDKALAATNKLPTLLMVHYPPFMKSASEPGGVYWNLEPSPRARLLALMEQAGVRTLVSGHLHRNLTNQFKNITLITTTTIAAADPQKKQKPGWMLLRVAADGVAEIEPRYLTRDPGAP